MRHRFLIILNGALLLGLVLWFSGLVSTPWVERYYSRGFYPWLSRWLAPVVNAVPFSLSSALLLLLLLIFLLFTIFMLRRKALVLWALSSLSAVLVLATSFVLLWGAHYRRASVEVQFELTESIRDNSAERLAWVLLEQLQQHASPISENEMQAAIAAISQSLHTIVQQRQQHPPILPSQVKILPKGTLFRWHSSGVMSPWLLEPHVDGALPPVYLIAVAAHELAHSAGYAGEADADFLGMLAALQAKNPQARYAGALYALQRLLPHLSETTQAEIRAAFPAQVVAQQRAYRQVWQHYPPFPILADIQQRAYDSYLRSQGVEAGLADYGRSIHLLLQAYQQGVLEVEVAGSTQSQPVLR